MLLSKGNKIHQIEIERNNITVKAFLALVRKSCQAKGMDTGIEQDEFEAPSACYDDTYFIRNGVKFARYGKGEPTRQLDAADAPAKAETLRIAPYDYQMYILNHDGSCFNEICEFTFDDGIKGHGYYYQLNN